MKKTLFVILTLAALLACKKENEQGQGGSGPASVVMVQPAQILFEALGEEGKIVRVTADGAWTAQISYDVPVSEDWLTITPMSAKGSANVTIRVSDNAAKDGRTAYVVFAPELAVPNNKLEVQQKGDNKVSIASGAEFAQWLAGLNSKSLDEATITADLDMSGVDFVPAKGFGGTLDGRGHSITNLSATQPLFKTSRGTIKDIVIEENCSFTPDSTVFGAIVARNEGTVQNCINKAPVTRTIAPTTKYSNLIAGVVGMSAAENTISGCKNYGKITFQVTNNGGFTSQGVAGVIALTAGSLEGCENYGEVSLAGGWHAGRACPARVDAAGKPDKEGAIDKGEIYTAKVGSSLGGVVGYVKGSLNACKNAGKIVWTESKIEGMTTSPAKFFTGGVAGNYYGTVTDCINEGELVITSVTSNGENYENQQNHQHAMGGVLGAFNNPAYEGSASKNLGSNVTGCINSGNISINSNSYKSWMWLGGVVGWPNGDDDSSYTKVGTMTSCSNSGEITVSGTPRIRVGGVAGVSPNMNGCSNTGDIYINGASENSSAAGLVGAHWGRDETIKNCTVNCQVDSKSIVSYALLIGNIDGHDSGRNSAKVEGGSVIGEVSFSGDNTLLPETPSIGLLVGNGAKDGSATIGTDAARISVKGSVLGTAIPQSIPGLLWGTNYKEENHKIYVQFVD